MSIPPNVPALPGMEGQIDQKGKKPAKLKPVKVGAVSLPIYHYGDGRWTTIYRLTKGGKRITESRKTESAIRERAVEICLDIARGRITADRMGPDERLQAVAARKQLAEVGMSLDAVAREVATAHELTGGAGILEMARFWAKHHAAGTTMRTVAQVHAELLHSKSDLALNVRYRRELKRDLGTFVTVFADTAIHEVSSAQILKWLREREVGWLRRNKLQSLVVTLFRFAKNERYLPQDAITEPERLTPLPKPADAPPPGVLTVAEMRIVIARVRPEYLPWAVLGAFAGLRQAEIARLHWERHFHWADNVIEISQEVAKRTTRKHGDARFVEMPANLVA